MPLWPVQLHLTGPVRRKVKPETLGWKEMALLRFRVGVHANVAQVCIALDLVAYSWPD